MVLIFDHYDERNARKKYRRNSLQFQSEFQRRNISIIVKYSSDMLYFTVIDHF